MGLNFNIRSIIFAAVDKFDGYLMRNLEVAEARQIAGRAGRFGTNYEKAGEVTVLGALAALDMLRVSLNPVNKLKPLLHAHLGIPAHVFQEVQDVVRGGVRICMSGFMCLLGGVVVFRLLKMCSAPHNNGLPLILGCLARRALRPSASCLPPICTTH
jgi:hypothetical protein